MRMDAPDQRMQSARTSRKDLISGVFFAARKVTSISEKQHSAVMFTEI